MTGFVYAIGDETGLVKIGWSSDPLRRLAKLSSDCPSIARLMGIVPATKEQEAQVHFLLSPWRVNREWFRLDGAVLAFVRMLQIPSPRRTITVETVHPLAAYRARQSPPLSQRDLAQLLGVSRETVWRWETGERMPDPESLLHITEKTGVSAQELRPDLAEIMKSEAAE